MADFTITRVSSKPPRAWSFTDKKTSEVVPMEAYTVMLQGESDAVEINRKTGDKPTVGEVLTGKLESTDFGVRFKKESKPYTPSKGYQPKDEVAIKAMWAIGQAIDFLGFEPANATLTDIEPLARDLFNMVERVKTNETSGYEKAAAAAQQIKNKALDTSWGEQTEAVNVDDIPF